MVQVNPLVWSKGEARNVGFVLKTHSELWRVRKKDSHRISSGAYHVSAGFKKKGLEFRKRDKFNGFKSRVGS